MLGKLPEIIEPFSTFGDEIAGETADQMAVNLRDSARLSAHWRCRPRTPRPNFRRLFWGHKLSEESKLALDETEAIYDGFKKQWPPDPTT